MSGSTSTPISVQGSPARIVPKVQVIGSLLAQEASNKDKSAKRSLEGIVRDYYSDTPLLVEIARCETRYRQYDKDGKVFRGRIDNNDVGIMQVNERYHLKRAEKLGFDIYTLEGNLAYAKYLYLEEGSDPWASSSACWGGYREGTVSQGPKSATFAKLSVPLIDEN